MISPALLFSKISRNPQHNTCVLTGQIRKHPPSTILGANGDLASLFEIFRLQISRHFLGFVEGFLQGPCLDGVTAHGLREEGLVRSLLAILQEGLEYSIVVRHGEVVRGWFGIERCAVVHVVFFRVKAKNEFLLVDCESLLSFKLVMLEFSREPAAPVESA